MGGRLGRIFIQHSLDPLFIILPGERHKSRTDEHGETKIYLLKYVGGRWSSRGLSTLATPSNTKSANQNEGDDGRFQTLLPALFLNRHCPRN